MKKALIIFAQSSQCLELETLLKSIVKYNDGIHLYIVHDGIASTWFTILQNKLKDRAVQITPVRIPEGNDLAGKNTFRYVLNYFVEEKTVMSLYPDMIVTGDLTPIFENDLSQVLNISSLQPQEGAEGGLENQLQVIHHHVPQESPLNSSSREDKLALKLGIGQLMKGSRRKGISTDVQIDLERGPVYPTLIHFDTDQKPWSELRILPYQALYWYHMSLSWEEAIVQVSFLTEAQVKTLSSYDYVGWVYTYSDELEHIEDLIRNLPTIQFIIAAPTEVSAVLKNLLTYPNVVLSPVLEQDGLLYKEILAEADFYLDINHFMEVGTVVSDIINQGKPVLAFEETQHGDQGQIVFSSNDLASMIAFIQHIEVESLLNTIGIHASHEGADK